MWLLYTHLMSLMSDICAIERSIEGIKDDIKNLNRKMDAAFSTLENKQDKTVAYLKVTKKKA